MLQTFGQAKPKKDPAQAERAEKDKPVLIREPEPATDPSVEAKLSAEPNPAQAEKSFNVANYYFKRKRYDAAIGRLKEAIRFNPKYIEAYKLLSRAYEKTRDPAKAIAVYQEYLAKFPASTAADDLQKEIQRLQRTPH